MNHYLPEHRCACGHQPAQPGVYPPPYPPYPAPYPYGPASVVQQTTRPWGRYIATGAAAAAVVVPVLLATAAALVAVGMAALALAVTALVIRWLIKDIRRG